MERKKAWHLCPDDHWNSWTTRKERPVSCPRCRRRFDSPYRKTILVENNEMVVYYREEDLKRTSFIPPEVKKFLEEKQKLT